MKNEKINSKTQLMEIDRKLANMLWETKQSRVVDDPNKYADHLLILKQVGFSKEDTLVFINELYKVQKLPN